MKRLILEQDNRQKKFLLLDEISANGPNGSLRAIRDPNFPQNILNVLFYGFNANPQRVCNLTVAQPQGNMS
jgi:hypothetical protein